MRDREPIGERFGPLTESMISLRLTPEAAGVLAFLHFRSGGKGVCSVGTRTLCKTFRMARNKASRIFAELQRRGCVSRKRMGRYQWETRIHFGPGSIPKPGRNTSLGRVQNATETRLQDEAEGLDHPPRITDGIAAVSDEQSKARRFAKKHGLLHALAMMDGGTA